MRLTKPAECALSSQRATTTAWFSGSIHTVWPPAPVMK